MEYSWLKEQIEAGQVDVISNLPGYLSPHPFPEPPLKIGWRSINAVARAISKTDRAKTAHVLLCLFDEFLPRLAPLMSEEFLGFVRHAMQMLRCCSEARSRGDDLPKRVYRLYCKRIGKGVTMGVHSIDREVFDALDAAFSAIKPISSAHVFVGATFDALCSALAESMPEDWLGKHECLHSWELHLITAQCIGRIESKFAFSDALSARLE